MTNSSMTYWRCQCGMDVPMGYAHNCSPYAAAAKVRAQVGDEGRGDQEIRELRWVAERALRYIREHRPSEDLEHDLEAAIDATPEFDKHRHGREFDNAVARRKALL